METIAPFIEVIDEIKEAGGEVFKMCFQCGLCDAVCPWNKVRNFSMRKLIREAAFGLTEIEGEDIWRCTTCGTCPDQCPRGVKQIDISVALRRVATEYEVFPASVKSARTARASLISEGNPLQGDRKKRSDWAKGLSVKPFTEDMEALYFVGCYLSYDPRMKKVATATANILNKAGVQFGILGDKESCCGESIRKTGSEEVFKNLAKQNIKTFIDAGVKKIIVSSPHCFHTFKNEYPEFMVNFEVIHMSQYVLELINDGRLELTGDYKEKVTFHDPCYLGRHNNVYDEPRDLLNKVSGLELVEMENFRSNSLCCGGGGGRIWMDTPQKERFSDIRLEQAKEAGAKVLATSCPYCITNFEESRLNLEYEDILEVKDITEIISEML
ncbi:MAG: (Fe-S)-binding protein [Desulfobacula sp.]|uniref:(Fe-S)-binding protein n=1 Tax=Desulfobacula sp. TaxID=2593537 RepID=UPI001D86DBDD|nr:(Fe-S)-binding protein [Desulfobacula sp.]MBT3486613.1 (Fe-S)-binding protein [Desulfobacula sp.]MBT3805682.1 (Fe-S)-binding protein [Desulfobacula sp.]MBT4023890.1 (Fe-S)-binding protein [Desulfobacula sp.]MBT4198984.1 (Fe-S)-binding protein [Desulfobacula sp.]